MKRAFALFLVVLFAFLCGCGDAERIQNTTIVRSEETTEQPSEPSEIRAVWISYLELTMPKEDHSEAAFRHKVKEMVDDLQSGRMNTVFLHVRPFSDALYRSEIFPCSACISGKEGVDPGYDALEIFCTYAKAAKLSVHAWINPFRIGETSKLEEKASDNPANLILTDNDPDNDSRVVDVNGTLYYDPASGENQDLILKGVRELLQSYPIDGVHIDDYFYPTTKQYIDRTEYTEYVDRGGTEKLDDWRRSQINSLVSRMYNCVKSIGEDKIFSISPTIQIEKNKNELYADVEKWSSVSGYCDWMIPQMYVGFEHETFPFTDAVQQWLSLTRADEVRMLFGLAAYKCGADDPYAGAGRSEWIENTDILPRQIAYLRSIDGYCGFSLYSYSYVFGENLSDNSNSEMKSVIDML